MSIREITVSIEYIGRDYFKLDLSEDGSSVELANLIEQAVRDYITLAVTEHWHNFGRNVKYSIHFGPDTTLSGQPTT